MGNYIFPSISFELTLNLFYHCIVGDQTVINRQVVLDGQISLNTILIFAHTQAVDSIVTLFLKKIAI